MLESSSWWEAPAGNNEVPRWAIGHTVSVKPSTGLALSAGAFGRRGDPLPLFLSQGLTSATQRAASNSVIDPATYRLRWDAQFGIAASLRHGPRLKLDAIAEVFVPLTTGSSDPSPPFETSRGFRFGLVTGF